MEQMIEKFNKALQSLDRLAARNILMESRGEWTPIQCVENLIVPALEQFGTGWEQGTVALSQVYMSGRICEELVDTILPPADPNRRTTPNIALAVLEDFHILGKRIVYSTMRASGFDLLDYGRVTVDELVNLVKDDNIEILLVSVLMLPSALAIKELRKKLDQSGADVKILVGGAPFFFDHMLWEEVGADARCRNASEAVETVARLSGGPS